MTNKHDVFWNALGSLSYALASMVLAFMVLRMAGAREGGIFGFGFSTLGQQLFIVAYFGIRPYHITDMRGEYSFGEYRRARGMTTVFALLLAAFYLCFMNLRGSYDIERCGILFLLVLYKLVDAYADVYESELQRQGRLYQTGQSLFFRTMLSAGTLLGSLWIWKNLLLSCMLAVLMQLFGTALFSVLPIRSCERDVRNLGEQGIDGVQWSVGRRQAEKLIRNTALLFLSVFLDFYVFSASKYGVDNVLGAESSGIFNILFMPTSFIYLLANFMIRPMLTRLSEEYSEGRSRDFRRSCRFMNLFVLLMGIVICLGAVLLGRWGLSIFELLLGAAYQGVMQRELKTFLLLILGGGLYALCNVQYYILVTMRRQREIFVSYLLTALAAVFTANRMVASGGMYLGAWNYVLLMGLLLVIFGGCVLRALACFEKEAGKELADISDNSAENNF